MAFDPHHSQHVSTQDGACRECFPDMPPDVDEAIARAEDALGRLPSDVFPATIIGGYFVASKSNPGAWWLVQVYPRMIDCPCPAGRRIADGDTDKPCRHMQRLLAYTKAEEARLRRPAAPANVSALID